MEGCGWLEGLRQALELHEPDVELFIASYGPQEHEPLVSGSTHYYSLAIDQPQGFWDGIAWRWRHEFIPEAAVDRARATISLVKPDLVHVHGTEHPLGLAALGLDIPTLVQIQGLASVCERYMLASLSTADLARDTVHRRSLRGSGVLHDYAVMRRRARIERRIIAESSYFAGQTDWDRTVLRLLNPSATYFSCSRVVQPAFYGPTWSRSTSDQTRILCTSRAAPYKGLEILLQAVGILRDAGYKSVCLRIAGSIVDTSMWSVLARLATRLNLNDHIHWLDRLPSDRLAEELQNASVFVMPSHIENESNALIEAMLVGAPCIAANVGGVSSTLRDGEDGLLYHDSDPFALAGAISRLIDDPELASALASQGRQTAWARCDPRMAASQTTAAYESVLTSAQRSTVPSNKRSGDDRAS